MVLSFESLKKRFFPSISDTWTEHQTTAESLEQQMIEKGKAVLQRHYLGYNSFYRFLFGFWNRSYVSQVEAVLKTEYSTVGAMMDELTEINQGGLTTALSQCLSSIQLSINSFGLIQNLTSSLSKVMGKFTFAVDSLKFDFSAASSTTHLELDSKIRKPLYQQQHHTRFDLPEGLLAHFNAQPTDLSPCVSTQRGPGGI